MSGYDRYRALTIIDRHLHRLPMPRPDREKLAEEILAELQSSFLTVSSDKTISDLTTATKGRT